MDRRGFPSLVPLSTLQHALYRNLNPQLRFEHPHQVPAGPPSFMAPPQHPAPAQYTHSPSPPSEDAPPAAQHAEATASAPRRSANDASHSCQWVDCDKVMPDPEALYHHLCNDHIGRKSTGNLCLTCKWKDCNTTCAKRDHITSHLRGTHNESYFGLVLHKWLAVHTPLKPHVCEVCNKPFKRPQDLKKHEKIHTEEHHVQHKHSKAITVADPAFSSRVRGDSVDAPAPPDPKAPVAPASTAGKVSAPVARAKSSSASLSESSSGQSRRVASLSCLSNVIIDFGVLPTPSPELQHSSIHYQPVEHQDMYRIQPSWEVLRADGTTGPASGVGSKRSYDYDEFFTDVKKRRVTPAYDPRELRPPYGIRLGTHMHPRCQTWPNA
jgi:hypothetical protein